MKCVGLLGGECLNQCLIVQGVAGLSVGVVLTNTQGKVVWLNRMAENLLGAKIDRTIGRPMMQVLRSPELLAFWQDADGQHENFFAEVTVRWPVHRDLKLSATRCQDGQGREIGRALLICDLTRERAVQVELSQAVAKRLLVLAGDHGPGEPLARLTQQELRMLRLVGQGLGNTEIAEKNKISSSTVRSHLKNLYRKLKLRSRAEAVSFAVRHHLI